MQVDLGTYRRLGALRVFTQRGFASLRLMSHSLLSVEQVSLPVCGCCAESLGVPFLCYLFVSTNG